MSSIRLRQFVATALIGALFIPLSVSLSAQDVQPDNSKVNVRDREKGAVTADQQKNDAADRQAVQKIRRSLVQDKGLSTYAHNVKVIVRDGQATLKGPVRSDAEKEIVEARAIEVVGAGHVVNELSVAPVRAKRPSRS